MPDATPVTAPPPAPPPPTALDAFSPTWRRVLFASALAIAGFFIPQEVPLEWYPLNEPGNDILYLELTCASDKDGDVQVFYNATRHINQLHSIFFPISPTEQTFTYTFPLLDAPIIELRLDPPGHGATLTIRRLRILDRRGTEIHRFTRDMFIPLNGIASITPAADGWKVTSLPDAYDPYLRIELPYPILAHGRDYRNLLRCLLSTGYLAGMLWILLLAVMFAFVRPTRWRDYLAPVGFMAVLALLFAPVGNRGLIRNSIHFARYQPPPEPAGLRLELDLAIDNPQLQAQVFWRTGDEFTEADSVRVQPEPHPHLQTLRFPLPRQAMQGLRFDPLNGAARLSVRGIRLVDDGHRTRAVLPLEALRPVQQVARAEVEDEWLLVDTVPDATDPILEFTPEAVAAVNAVIAPRGHQR